MSVPMMREVEIKNWKTTSPLRREIPVVLEGDRTPFSARIENSLGQELSDQLDPERTHHLADAYLFSPSRSDRRREIDEIDTSE